MHPILSDGLVCGSDCKCPPQCRRHGFEPLVRKIPWKSKWQNTPVFLPGKSNGQRLLVGYNPWCHKESDMTEWVTHIHMLNLLHHFFCFIFWIFGCEACGNICSPTRDRTTSPALEGQVLISKPSRKSLEVHSLWIAIPFKEILKQLTHTESINKPLIWFENQQIGKI